MRSKCATSVQCSPQSLPYAVAVVRRKTIYEYHRVNMKDHDITNLTAIYLKALPTCNLLISCDSCLGAVDEENKSLNVTLFVTSLFLVGLDSDRILKETSELS